MSEASGPEFTFTDACEKLLEAIDLSPAAVVDSYRRRTGSMIVPATPAHVYAVRWLDDTTAVLTSCTLTRMEWLVDRARPTEIQFTLALRLRTNLPAGPISRRMQVDQIWQRVADSFGVPVTCHDDFPAHTRYTGPWDGQSPKYTADERGTLIVDGTLETSGDNAKYVWVCDVEAYLAWLRDEPFGGVAAAPPEATIDVDAVPRVVFAPMRPEPLSRPMVLRADIGELAVRLLCTHCSLRTIHDPPYFDPPMRCLHVFGAELLDPENIPQQLEGKEYLAPCDFVTDLRAGPARTLAGGHAPQRSAVLPSDYRPGNKMSLRSIESLLADFRQPT